MVLIDKFYTNYYLYGLNPAIGFSKGKKFTNRVDKIEQLKSVYVPLTFLIYSPGMIALFKKINRSI